MVSQDEDWIRLRDAWFFIIQCRMTDSFNLFKWRLVDQPCIAKLHFCFCLRRATDACSWFGFEMIYFLQSGSLLCFWDDH